MGTSLVDTELWRETVALPEVVDGVRAAFAEPDDELTGALAHLRGARRIVVTGNGAAAYAGLAMESAARLVDGPAVAYVPAGILAAGDFAWREGDVTLVISASGELRDTVSLVRDDAVPRPWVALTMTPDSTIGAGADARVLVRVLSQNAITHTQAYVANVVAAILIVDSLVDSRLGAHIDFDTLAERLTAAVDAAPAWASGASAAIAEHETVRLAFASGAGHSAALETALLMKEVWGSYVEGLETREAATSGMYALRPGDLVLAHTLADDPLGTEAETVIEATGARVLRFPAPPGCTRLELPVLGFPAAVALAGALGIRDGRDIDDPDWITNYYRTARAE